MNNIYNNQNTYGTVYWNHDRGHRTHLCRSLIVLEQKADSCGVLENGEDILKANQSLKDSNRKAQLFKREIPCPPIISYQFTIKCKMSLSTLPAMK